MARTVGLVLDEMAAAGIDGHMAITAAVTDGQAIYAIRFANDDRPATLFYALGARPLTAAGVPADDAEVGGCLIVSEPLDDMRGVWREVPAGHMLIAADGGIGEVAFTPVRG